MKVLLWACAVACASAANSALPDVCMSGACVASDVGRDTEDGWFSKAYLIYGKRMSVATQAEAIRWTCWGGDPTSTFAPHYKSNLPLSATSVELIDCNVPPVSYQQLFTYLTLTWGNVKNLTISNLPQNINWPSIEEIRDLNYTYRSDDGDWVAAAATNVDKNYLKHLSLRGTPMSTEQLISIYGIWTLTLVDTGLTKVVNLSEFSKLHRLELHEPMLEDAQLLGTAPALDELVLRAPDAGLAPMPRLREATFLDVYAMGSIFGNCKNLERLTIKGGELDRIYERWLAGCTALSYLKLTRLWNLRRLPDDLLSDTKNLRQLDLSHNSLESLPGSLFSNVKRLITLNLRHNFLMALPSDLLSGPTSLRYVCVSHNGRLLNMQLRSLPYRPRGIYYDNCDDLF